MGGEQIITIIVDLLKKEGFSASEACEFLMLGSVSMAYQFVKPENLYDYLEKQLLVQVDLLNKLPE